MAKDYSEFFRRNLQREATADDQIRILEQLFNQPISTQTRSLARVDTSRDLTERFNNSLAGLGIPEEKIEEAILAIKEKEENSEPQSENRNVRMKLAIGTGMVIAGFTAMMAGVTIWTSPPWPFSEKVYSTPIEELHAKDSYVRLEDLIGRNGFFHDSKGDGIWNENNFDINGRPITSRWSGILMHSEVSANRIDAGWLEGGFAEVIHNYKNADGTVSSARFVRSVSYYNNAKMNLMKFGIMDATEIIERDSPVSMISIFRLEPQPDIDRKGVKSEAYKIKYITKKDDAMHEAYAIATAYENLFQLFLIKGDVLDYSGLVDFVFWENSIFDLILDH